MDKRRVTLETEGSLTTNLIQEIIEGNTVKEDLQHLQAIVSSCACRRVLSQTYRVHVAHVSVVDKASRFKKGNFFRLANTVGLQSLT